MRNVAVILAGGRGKRLGLDVPKQFIEIAGRTLLEWSVIAFAINDAIDEICVVVPNDYVARCTEFFKSASLPFSKKIKHVVSGGAERFLSTGAVLDLYRSEECRLIIHDAARPLISQTIINRCVNNNYEACAVGIPVSSTMWQVGEGKNMLTIDAIPNRALLWEAQTPQCFFNTVLLEAYGKAILEKNFVATDECSLVRRYMPNIPIHIIEGEDINIKITYKKDLEFVRLILAQRQQIFEGEELKKEL